MMHWGGDASGGWAVTMAVLMLLFWGSILTLIWVAIRTLLHHGPPPPTADARAVLDVRLACGEIEPEEYQRRLELIGTGR